MKGRGLPPAGTAHPLIPLSTASFKGFNFPEGKIILEGRWVGLDKEALFHFQPEGNRLPRQPAGCLAMTVLGLLCKEKLQKGGVYTFTFSRVHPVFPQGKHT